MWFGSWWLYYDIGGILLRTNYMSGCTYTSPSPILCWQTALKREFVSGMGFVWYNASKVEYHWGYLGIRGAPCDQNLCGLVTRGLYLLLYPGLEAEGAHPGSHGHPHLCPCVTLSVTEKPKWVRRQQTVACCGQGERGLRGTTGPRGSEEGSLGLVCSSMKELASRSHRWSVDNERWTPTAHDTIK